MSAFETFLVWWLWVWSLLLLYAIVRSTIDDFVWWLEFGWTIDWTGDRSTDPFEDDLRELSSG